MPKAVAKEEAIAGVRGVRFSTDARQGDADEPKLQEIQRDLSGGVVLLPSPTTLPHLSLRSVATVDGPSYSTISLWVPVEKRSQAAERLKAAGFTLS